MHAMMYVSTVTNRYLLLIHVLACDRQTDGRQYTALVVATVSHVIMAIRHIDNYKRVYTV